jgi:anti-anti-sigma factor
VDGAVVVRLAGELDLSAVGLDSLLLGVVESGFTASIVLDMAKVEFIDAHSVGVIERAWAAAQARGRVLRVDGLHGLPARVFQILGLEPMLCTRAVSRSASGNADG